MYNLSFRAAPRHLLLMALVAMLTPGSVFAQNPPSRPPTQPPAQPPVPVTTPAVTPGQRTPAQEAAEARLGRPVTNAEINDAIRRSGLSQQEIKARLQAAGYSGALADPFFGGGVSAAGAASTPAPTTTQTASFVEALEALGLMAGEAGETLDEAEGDRGNVDRLPPRNPRLCAPLGFGMDMAAAQRAGATQNDSLQRTPTESRQAGRTVDCESQIFGKTAFGKSRGMFEQTTVGPVDPSYRLGATDQLQVVFTGAVEQAYNLEVRRDGSVVVPQVGQLNVAGLTLESARGLLRQRAAQSFSGIATGRINVDVSVSRVRTKLVTVIGEVEAAGPYQVSGLSTALHAISRAGGPAERGSFRNIEVRRGGQVIATLDLYHYLVNGDVSNDIRTEQGDVIFVPLNQRSITLVGAVRRPSMFELAATEGFTELLRFGGGLLPSAAADRVQIDCILPPAQRAPGRDRIVVDVMLNGNIDSLARIPLFDGDIVKVFEVGTLRRGSLRVLGEVFQPGVYQLTPNMTLGDLLDNAQGLLPTAAKQNIKVLRTLTVSGKPELISVDVTLPSGLQTRLEEFDEIRVLDSRVGDRGPIVVNGAVRRAFSTPAAENATLRDMIDLAGGFFEYALVDRVKIQRAVPATGRTEQLSIDFTTDAGKAFPVLSGDRINVLDGRLLYPSGEVVVAGAVTRAGRQPFVERQALQDVIDLMGGFKEEAARVDVARRKNSLDFNDTTSVVFSFPVFARTLPPEAQGFILQRDDRIMVLSSPGYRQQRFADVSGHFRFPGSHPITENVDRVSDIVKRAGGLLPGAYLRSGRIMRGGRILAIDFERAMKEDKREDIVLHAGDVISIRNDPGTVFISGEVERPALVKFDRGMSLEDYLERAGGALPTADKRRITVEDPSGMVKSRRRYGAFTKNPEIHSGAILFVPAKGKDAANKWKDAFTMAAQIGSTLASLAIAYLAVRK